MQAYKRKLKVRNAWLIGLMAALLALFLIAIRMENDALGSSAHYVGFISGFFVSMECALGALILRNILAIRDEKRLRRQHIEEADERKALIRQKMDTATVNALTILLIIAAFVAANINATVFYTLLAAVYLTMMLRVLSKLYFARKFR